MRVAKALGGRPQVYTQGYAGKAPALGKKTEVRILRASAYGDAYDRYRRLFDAVEPTF